ncbi:MAG TPA: hypothetical protein VIK28_02335 [Sedimentisphaerales bacterium]
MTTFRASEQLDLGIYLVVGLGSQFRGFKNLFLPLDTLRPAMRDYGGRALFVFFRLHSISA